MRTALGFGTLAGHLGLRLVEQELHAVDAVLRIRVAELGLTRCLLEVRQRLVAGCLCGRTLSGFGRRALACVLDLLREVALDGTRSLELVLALPQRGHECVTLGRQEPLQRRGLFLRSAQLALQLGRVRLRCSALAVELLAGCMLNGPDLVARIKAHARKLLARLALGIFDLGLRIRAHLNDLRLRVAANLGDLIRRALRLSTRAGFGCRARAVGLDAGACLGLGPRPLFLRLLCCSARCSFRALGGVAFGCGCTLLRFVLGGSMLARGPLGRSALSLCPLGIRARRFRNSSGMRDSRSLGLRIEHAHDESRDAGDRSPCSIANAPDLRARIDRAISSEPAHAARCERSLDAAVRQEDLVSGGHARCGSAAGCPGGRSRRMSEWRHVIFLPWTSRAVDPSTRAGMRWRAR
jgi:hypothetical protein